MGKDFLPMIQCLEAIIEKVSKSIYIKNKHLYGKKHTP